MATITATLGAGSVTSPYFYEITITKQLCKKTSQAPVFNPVFSLVGYRSVGTGQYEAVVNVQGIVTFTPCGSCCAKTQTVNDNFMIPFASTTTISEVSVAGGTATNTLITNGCKTCCSNIFASDVPLSLTVTTT